MFHICDFCRTGLILGYVSATAYLKSRVAQLVKNWIRGSAEGLAASMFLCAITGNVTSAAGIIVRLNSTQEFIWQLPWLIGMLGNVAMDVVIAYQSASAGAPHNHDSEALDSQRQSAAGNGGESSSTTPLLPVAPQTFVNNKSLI